MQNFVQYADFLSTAHVGVWANCHFSQKHRSNFVHFYSLKQRKKDGKSLKNRTLHAIMIVQNSPRVGVIMP
jgi:hypothetical protein